MSKPIAAAASNRRSHDRALIRVIGSADSIFMPNPLRRAVLNHRFADRFSLLNH
jgi:hypothetical protein